MSQQVHLEHELVTFDADLEGEIPPNQKVQWTTALVTELMAALCMKPLSSLEIYDAVDNAAPGWSFIQAITTSHIAGHYFAAPGPRPHFHLDIYSCKTFDSHKVIELLKKHMPLQAWTAVKICRRWNDGNAPEVEIYSDN